MALLTFAVVLTLAALVLITRRGTIGGRILLAVSVVLIALAGIFFHGERFSVDSCLDRGGRWDYELGVCRLE